MSFGLLGLLTGAAELRAEGGPAPMIEVGDSIPRRAVLPPEVLYSWYRLARLARATENDLVTLASGWEVAVPREPEAGPAPGPLDLIISLDFLDRIIRFIDGFAGASDDFGISDFRAEFKRRIENDRLPGLAWVLVAMKSSVQLEQFQSIREGGAFGIQIPLAGEGALKLDPEEWHLVLRVMPLGGDYERIEVRDEHGDWTTAERFPIQVKPTLEAEIAYRGQLDFVDFQPGARLAVRPTINRPGDISLRGELFVRFRVFSRPNGFVDEVHLVPRCVFEFHHESPAEAGLNDSLVRSLFADAAQRVSCFMSISATIGN